VEIEIKESKLPNESKSYEFLIINILGFIESYLTLKGNSIPKNGKILVYIDRNLRVRFGFENTPRAVEVKFRIALKEFYKL
jgi:hypothetical protein